MPDHSREDLYSLHPESIEGPPETFGGIFRRIGPGLIVAASVVGSGELIATTVLGAENGYSLLWLVVLSCSKPSIQGYTDQLSVKAGDQIGLHISTNAKRYSVQIARVGGKREVVWTKEGLPGTEYPIPEDCVPHGSNWPQALKVPVPEHWRFRGMMLKGTLNSDTKS